MIWLYVASIENMVKVMDNYRKSNRSLNHTRLGTFVPNELWLASAEDMDALIPTLPSNHFLTWVKKNLTTDETATGKSRPNCGQKQLENRE